MSAGPETSFEFRLPDLGEGIHEAQILSWQVRVGQPVQAFQVLCDVEFAKATVELTSPVAGVVSELRIAAGQTAHRGDVLVVLDTSGVARSDQSHPARQAAGVPDRPADHEAEPAEWVGIVGAPPGLPSAPGPLPIDAQRGGSPGMDRKVFAAPIVRRMARDMGVELECVRGTGPQGRVRLADLEAYVGARTARADAAPAAPLPADGESVPLSGLRKRIAEHMIQAVRHAPLVSAMDLFDVTDLVAARRSLASSLEAEGVALTYLPFVVKASIEALRAFPTANATVDEATGSLTRRSVYNIGIATAVPDGLVVPVVANAERLSIAELAVEIRRLIGLARARQLAPADLTGGTFTISSFGSMPGAPLFATPIVNHPEVAILGVGRIEEQPRVVDGQIVARHCMGISLTFDHRFIDGEGAGLFLAALRRHLERPLELLVRLR